MVRGLGSVLGCRGLWGLDGSCTFAIHLRGFRVWGSEVWALV